MSYLNFRVFICAAIFFCSSLCWAGKNPRARDLGIPFTGQPGPLNALTDVAGVEVGQVSVVLDKPRVVRTGLTAIWPRGKKHRGAVMGSWFTINGNGELTGTHLLEEHGDFYGPIMTTGTHSVGLARDSVIKWMNKGSITADDGVFSLPLVGETWDGHLSDPMAFALKEQHVFQALEGATSGPIVEGNVGGGTGMICFEFKCGIGTASRLIKIKGQTYTVGVLMQANFGLRRLLQIGGVPVGKKIPEHTLGFDKDSGSILAIIGTDAPLLPHQLKRLAKRATHGIARLGSVSGDGSGDIFMAFSTGNSISETEPVQTFKALDNKYLDVFFEAVTFAVEEAVVNALVAAETVVGFQGHQVYAVPHERLRELVR